MNDQVTLTKIGAAGRASRISGTLAAPIQIGSPVTVWVCPRRDTVGLFRSSPVVSLTTAGFKTRNSEYRVKAN